MNRFALTAGIIEISPIRYTPSGLPVVECRLEHESQLEEAGVSRKVKLLLKAKAVGMLAGRLAKYSGLSALRIDREYATFIAKAAGIGQLIKAADR